MISFEYGWIKAGEVVLQTRKTDGVNGIALLAPIQRALELSRHPLVNEIQCGNGNYPDMTSDELLVLAKLMRMDI